VLNMKTSEVHVPNPRTVDSCVLQWVC